MNENQTSMPASRPAGSDVTLSPELEQVRATVHALHNAAALLQGALDQRHALAAEMASVEQSLAASHAELARADHEVARTRAEQTGVLVEFDKLVQASMTRRATLLAEINELERKRDVLALQPTPVVAAAKPVVVDAPSVIAIEAYAAPAAATPRSKHKKSLPMPGWRQWVTILLGAILVSLAALVTPVSQVFGGLQLLAVMSGSMEPAIHVGGIVGVRPVPASDLNVGDVITFVNQNSPDISITHRIVNLENRAGQTVISTRGDANDSVDAVTTTPSRAVGRVEFTAPWLGYLMVWLASPVAKMAILAVSVIGFALPSVRLPVRRKSTPEADADPDSYSALASEIQALLPNST